MNNILFNTRPLNKNTIISRKYNNEEFRSFHIKKTLKNKLLIKLYNTKHLSKNSRSLESSKFCNLINDMNEQLNVKYDHIFQNMLFHNKKFFDIILIHFKIKYLEEFFSKSSNEYSNIDKIDFYKFLLIFYGLIDEIIY